MTRAAVVWSEGTDLKLAELREQGENIISRSGDAVVSLTDRTVSRSPHAVLRCEGVRFVLEHLRSGVAPSRVNEAVIARPTALSDGDRLGIGEVTLTFLDLAGGDRRAAYARCSNPSCHRRNSIDRTDCWFCGENLANADSVAYDVTRVEFRAVAGDGTRYDLLDGEHFVVTKEGAGSVVEGTASQGETAAVELGTSSPRLRVGSSADALFNGTRPTDGAAVRTGDRLAVNGAEFLFIVR